MEVSDQLHAAAALPARKNPGTHRLEVRTGPQSRSGRFERGKNGLPLLEFEPLLIQQPGHSTDYVLTVTVLKWM